MSPTDAMDADASPDRPRPWRALGGALGLYLIWTAATYLLEGRIYTLLRPEATLDRLIYAIVANLLIGLGGATWLLRRWVRSGLLRRAEIGFWRGRRTLWSIATGLVLGLILYGIQSTPVWHPVVMLNAFAQVLVVSVAEIMVCWAVVGSVCFALLRPYGSRIALTGAVVAASVLFGIYHLAHSPPFNSLDMVLLLSGVGLGTSVFYFMARDVYGTLVFHNLMGLYGVTASLHEGDRLMNFMQVQGPLLAMAAATILLLIAADRFGVRFERMPNDSAGSAEERLR